MLILRVHTLLVVKHYSVATKTYMKKSTVALDDNNDNVTKFYRAHKSTKVLGALLQRNSNKNHKEQIKYKRTDLST